MHELDIGIYTDHRADVASRFLATGDARPEEQRVTMCMGLNEIRMLICMVAKVSLREFEHP
jgi:hypothetical protein